MNKKNKFYKNMCIVARDIAVYKIAAFCKKSIYSFICIMTHIRPTKKISKYDQINVKIHR
jgi:hypothetical protein